MRRLTLSLLSIVTLLSACGDDTSGGDGGSSSGGSTSSGDDCPPDAGGTQAEVDAAADALCVARDDLGTRAGCTIVGPTPTNVCYAFAGVLEEDIPGCEAEVAALLDCERAQYEVQAPETCECKEPNGMSCSKDPSACDAEDSAFRACRTCR